MISGKRKILSLVFKLALIASSLCGVIMSGTSDREEFMGGSTVFMFFTIQSNIAIALVCLIGFIILLAVKDISGMKLWHVIKFVMTVAITLTGTVFCFILAPTLGSYAWLLQNVLTHVAVPVLAIADFFTVGRFLELKKRHVFFVTLPPLAYLVYASIGYVSGWQFVKGHNYPYFFLNWGSPAGAFGFSDELPFLGCVWWILIILAWMIIVGCLYLAVLKKIRKKA